MTADTPRPLPEDLVTLMHAHSPAEATVVSALLRGAGIAFYLDGRQLMDDFAMSQAVLGLKTEISVRPSDLARAQLLLDEARESGRHLNPPGEGHGGKHGH